VCPWIGVRVQRVRRRVPKRNGTTTRDVIFRRDGFRCVYCGQTFPGEALTLDHVEPRMRGGDRSAGNLVTCCGACNASKGGQAAWAWLANQPDVRANFLKYASKVWPRLRRAVEEAAK
jgi:HNH endonuclease